jgi:hypothetical protein
MKYVKKRLILPVALSLVAFLVFSVFSFAQTPAPANYNVTVSPVFFNLTANPGDAVSTKIRIRNNTTSPLPIKISVKKMSGDLNGALTLTDDNSDGSLSWIEFSSEKIIATPLEWVDVPFTIKIPKDAAYGYYFAITFTQDQTSTLKTTGAAINGAAAVPILLIVNKAGAKAEAKITDFSVAKSITEYLPVDFSVKVVSQGNVHVQPHGNIFITDGKNDLATLDINPNLGSVIPNAQKIFNASWTDGFIVNEQVMEYGQPKLDKNGNPEKKLTINWDKLTSFRIGKYTANLVLVYDNGTKDVPMEASLTFWVFPYKVVIFLIVVLFIAFFAIRFSLKAYVNREIHKKLQK